MAESIHPSDDAAIVCRGIRTHNLKSLSLSIPLHRWTTVTGVSGSGKSSLVFDTIYAESQRRFLETLGTYERQFLEGIPEGDSDSIENVPAAIALKQTNAARDPRSVVATAADLGEPLRVLFTALMEPLCVRCGTQVEQHTLEQLIGFLNKLLKKGTTLATVSITWSSTSSERKRLAHGLMQEGYLRIVDQNGEVVLLEEFLETKDFDSVATSQLVLDRLNISTPRDELRNRAEMLWSQVHFSSQFSSLTLISNTNETRVLIDPWCPRCKMHTTSIQTSDLDWQSVLGACPSCQGIGNIPAVDPQKVIPNPQLSIEEGAIKPWSTKTYTWFHKTLVAVLKANGISPKTAWQDLDQATQSWIWHKTDPTGKFQIKSTDYISLDEFFAALEAERYKTTSRILLAKYRQYITCPDCKGERLNPAGRNAICLNRRFPELMTLEVRDVLQWVADLETIPAFVSRKTALHEIHVEVTRKLELLQRLGLSSTQLWRRCRTLSGGEYQRVLLCRALGNGLTDALYVLDEPTVGLGSHEIPHLAVALRDLVNLGNTLLVVEHDRHLIEAADSWIELGPGGGAEGGHILPAAPQPRSMQFPRQGLPTSLVTESMPTSESLCKPNRRVLLSGFSCHNCHNLNLEVPIGFLTVITGPSGAGKSTLLHNGLEEALNTLSQNDTNSREDENGGIWKELEIPEDFFKTTEVVAVEQRPMHRTVTSVAATVLGVMDTLRRLFSQTPEARKAGLTPGHFSFNSTGACPECQGRGIIKEDLFFLGEVEKNCPLCGGKRYSDAISDVRWHGRTLVEWLDTSIRDCAQTFRQVSSLISPLNLASRLGIGHLPLGVSTTQISGGEAQRLRIAASLAQSKKALFCVLDEPTRGLSEVDVGHLLRTLLELCEQGHTFCVVEHHEEFAKHAHQLIVMGPGSGREGGRIMERKIREEILHGNSSKTPVNATSSSARKSPSQRRS